MVFPFGKKKGSTACADGEILAGLRAKSGPAFERAIRCLFGRCRDRIQNGLRAAGAGAEDAQDVFQDAILALLKNVLEQGREVTNPCGYLYRIALFIWRKRRSRQHPQVPLEQGRLVEESEPPLGFEAELDLDLTLEECRKQLSQRGRDVIDDYLDGLSMEEIAQKRGLKNAHVARQTKLRAQHDLRNCAENKLMRN